MGRLRVVPRQEELGSCGLVVDGLQTAPRAIAVARATGEAMGKRVIDAQDIAGFLVNRVNRPFFLEALRILQDGIATVEQIDRIVRLGGGFRMGPFELMGLIGIETNHAVAAGFLRQIYGQPRRRPSPLAARSRPGVSVARAVRGGTGTGATLQPGRRSRRVRRSEVGPAE